MDQRLGVDTGGTFTDFVWLGADGRTQIHKQLSTPHDPSEAILSGIETMMVPETAVVVHGSTVATNALLERKGARTALITTKGFADVLAIGRQNRPDIYALVPQKPPPLVPANWRLEVAERVTASGEVLHPLNLNKLPAIWQRLQAEQIESVAVCLLFSFLHLQHEQQIRQFLQEQAGDALHISLSSDILPEYREYERTATTVINAYVVPLMTRYLRRLAAGVQPRRLSVMQSNGGIISAATAGAQAARTALSGPAGGVVGARFVAGQAGFPEIITFDMGGTSTDVALCPGRLPTTASGEIAGLPLRLPIIDIHTVGAGGGSMAGVDAGGALQVGPESAGAFPGPACYGRTEKEIRDWRLETEQKSQVSGLRSLLATVTDANLVLGRLDADHFLGGTMRLDETAAREALSNLAEKMKVDDAETAAWGVIQVANANMERAIRRISVERGYDPRRFTLMPFGGAGPLHACELAESLQIPRVLVPPVPGVLSALGMLVAAPTKDYSQTVMRTVQQWSQADEAWLAAQAEPIAARAIADMVAEGHEESSVTLRYRLDVRYKGQSHELTVPWQAGDLAVSDLFHAAHEQRYGYRLPDDELLEVVTLRVTATSAADAESALSAGVAPVDSLANQHESLGEPDASTAIIDEKMVWFGERPLRHGSVQAYQTNLYNREKLRPGHQFSGPAIVFQYDTTIVIPPSWETAVDQFHNLILTKGEETGD
ncbi:hydantoinase/oxoprolinase family protein [Candidatus Leptofilum sp.]|uniref:hydantoinase/oxoprolinase family protein n=1 Tax=Candidatus Leptofilum sp. TaxID=3241576 RepID=UPI003B5B625A